MTHDRWSIVNSVLFVLGLGLISTGFIAFVAAAYSSNVPMGVVSAVEVTSGLIVLWTSLYLYERQNNTS